MFVVVRLASRWDRNRNVHMREMMAMMIPRFRWHAVMIATVSVDWRFARIWIMTSIPQEPPRSPSGRRRSASGFTLAVSRSGWRRMRCGERARLTCHAWVLIAPLCGSCVSGQSPLQITSCALLLGGWRRWLGACCTRVRGCAMIVWPIDDLDCPVLCVVSPYHVMVVYVDTAIPPCLPDDKRETTSRKRERALDSSKTQALGAAGPDRTRTPPQSQTPPVTSRLDEDAVVGHALTPPPRQCQPTPTTSRHQRRCLSLCSFSSPPTSSPLSSYSYLDFSTNDNNSNTTPVRRRPTLIHAP